MATAEAIRDFIPYGNCVEPVPSADGSLVDTEHELFRLLDTDHSYDALITSAINSCLTCPQLEHCQEQQVKIVDLIWSNGGQHPVVGAARIDRREQPAKVVDLGVPTLKWDLSRLPAQADERLKFIRQGARADQLKIVSRAPDNVKIIAGNYQDMMAGEHEDLIEDFSSLLSDSEQEKAMRYIVVTLCQQADFAKFSKGIKSSKPGSANPRYNPDTHNYELNMDTFALYMQEVCAIKRMGFKNPGHLAIYHSAEYMGRILGKYGDIANKAIILQVIGSSSRDPATALKGFAARLQQLRERGLLNEHTIRRLALSPNIDVSSITVESVVEMELSERSRTAPATKRTGSAAQPRRGKAAAIYSSRTPLGKRAAGLNRDFGKHPDVTPGIINHFARAFPRRATQEMSLFIARMLKWRSWAIQEENAAYEPIPETFLRQHALRGDVSCFEDIVRAHKLKVLKQRFDAMDRRADEAERINVPSWAINRITRLFPVDFIEPAAENLRSLLGSGLLGYSVSELSDLLDPSVHIEIDGINDPRTRKYVTFSGALGNMSGQQRILLSHLYGLDRLIYGRQLTDEQVGNYTGIPIDELSSHWRTVIERGADLVGNEAGGAVPFSTIRQDLTELILANPSDAAVETTRKERATSLLTVVGRDAVTLALADADIKKHGIGLPVDKMGWISDVINSSFPPSLKENGAKAVFSAIANGNLVILGSTYDDFRISLSGQFYGSGFSDRHRVAAAQLMDLNRPLYGGDLAITLENLLPKAVSLAKFVTDEVVARLPGWEDKDAARSRLNATMAAIGNIAANEFRPSQLWLYQGDIFALESGTSSRFNSKSYNHLPAKGWTAFRELGSQLLLNEQEVVGVLRKAKLTKDNRRLARNSSGLLDVYFSAEAVSFMSSIAA